MDATVAKSTILKVTTRTESGTAPKLPSEYLAEEEPQPKDEDLYPPKTSEVAKRLISQAENEIDSLKEKGLSAKEIIREYIETPENSDDEDMVVPANILDAYGLEDEEEGNEEEESPNKTKSPRKKAPPKIKKPAARSPKTND